MGLILIYMAAERQQRAGGEKEGENLELWEKREDKRWRGA